MRERISLLEELMEVEEGTLSEDTVLDTLEEWDSFAKLCVVAEVKKRRGITIGAEELQACKTVSDVIKYW